jgi:hypothetical protein
LTLEAEKRPQVASGKLSNTGNKGWDGQGIFRGPCHVNVGQHGKYNGLFMGCEGGEVEEEEAEVVNWASKDSGGCKGQKFPSIHYSGALGEKVEDRFRGRTTSEASWRGCEAKAVASDLEGEDVV